MNLGGQTPVIAGERVVVITRIVMKNDTQVLAFDAAGNVTMSHKEMRKSKLDNINDFLFPGNEFSHEEFDINMRV